MDAQDEADLYQTFKTLNDKLLDIYEKEAYKYWPKLEKVVKERLGWRLREPQKDYERYLRFMDFIKEVYLKPSLNLKEDDSLSGSERDCDWDDVEWN